MGFSFIRQHSERIGKNEKTPLMYIKVLPTKVFLDTSFCSTSTFSQMFKKPENALKTIYLNFLRPFWKYVPRFPITKLQFLHIIANL